MWFSLFALVLVLAVTFYQGLMGAFTGVINCILTILAAALAFGLYEDLYYSFLLDRQPDAGRAIALMAIFILSLLFMRLIVDALVRDNMKLPIYADRAVGGIFGFITAMITIGTLCVAIQMLPFPYQWLGFSRYSMYNADDGSVLKLKPKSEKETEEETLGDVDMSKVKFVRSSLWLSPDSFAIALASHLSDNALTAGGASMARVHPDLLDEIWWARFNAKGQKTTVSRKQDAIQVQACWVLGEDELLVLRPGKDEQQKTRFSLVEAYETDDKLPGGQRWLAVRAKLSNDAVDDGGMCRFNSGQVRLVTRGKGGRTRSYHLVGLNVPGENLVNAPDKFKDYYYRLATGDTVAYPPMAFTFVFQVPDDEDPWFIEFRRNARAEIREIAKEAPEPVFAPPKNEGGKKKPDKKANNTRNGPSNDQTGDNPDATDGRAGRVSRVHSNLEGCFFGGDLPFELSSYTGDGLEHQGDRITNGRVIAKLDKNDDPVKGSDPVLKRLDVKSDKQLLHLSVTRLQPGSLYGQVKDFAAQNQNVYVKDSNGKKHPAVGMYAIATVGKDRLFELHWLDENGRMSSAGIPKLTKMRRDNLRSKYELYYLFEVPPGARIEAFVNPNGKEESYRSIELVAPQQ